MSLLDALRTSLANRNFRLLRRHRADLRAEGTLRYWLSVAALVVLGLALVAAPLVLVVWLMARWVQ